MSTDVDVVLLKIWKLCIVDAWKSLGASVSGHTRKVILGLDPRIYSSRQLRILGSSPRMTEAEVPTLKAGASLRLPLSSF
ncbi:MAG: hypothetical protein DI595_11025 [Agrobacterium fabrum]|uniref:Uncharacterized protein n=1 Tax=Agrobacterium fabrum TaxID=1176649 RepID=A0A2W5F334_9HYPH|nr:MAG: hypothetical protein DI595_11025 [Agrobacterium fabrum]